jgi:hypothetical protein
MENAKTKTIMYVVLLILFTSTIHAEPIDLNDNKQPNQDLIDKINSYDIVKEIAREYNCISINITDKTQNDNYKIVLAFKENKLHSIEEYSNQTTDLSINLTRDQINDLLSNYKSMSWLDKIKFIINSDIPISDAIKLSGIAMGVRI